MEDERRRSSPRRNVEPQGRTRMQPTDRSELVEGSQTVGKSGNGQAPADAKDTPTSLDVASPCGYYFCEAISSLTIVKSRPICIDAGPIWEDLKLTLYSVIFYL
jgi:hypothetical protein